MTCDAWITKSICSQLVPKDPGGKRLLRHHTQKRREPSLPSSPSTCGIRGSIAERVRPQKRGGDKSFLVAVNFQPMWDPQFRHWAIVQAYLQAKTRGQRDPRQAHFKIRDDLNKWLVDSIFQWFCPFSVHMCYMLPNASQCFGHLMLPSSDLLFLTNLRNSKYRIRIL